MADDNILNDTDARVLRVIRLSLATWRISATVTVQPEGRWLVSADGHAPVSVGRAPLGIPFRWLLTTSTGRQRPAGSVAGLLRVLRTTLDPEWRPSRARVVPLTPPLP